MHSSSKSYLSSEKYNPFICSVNLKHFVFCRFYKCLNLAYGRSISVNSFRICIYYMSYHVIFTPKNCSILIITLPSQSFMSSFNSKAAPNNISLNAFPDKPDLQCKKPKNSSRTSRFLSTNLRTSDICSLLDVPNASSAITE